jgi:hypothetical protein
MGSSGWQADVVSDRDWIVKTALDPEATRGEFEVALAAATPIERGAIRQELDFRISVLDSQINTTRDRRSHRSCSLQPARACCQRG